MVQWLLRSTLYNNSNCLLYKERITNNLCILVQISSSLIERNAHVISQALSIKATVCVS